MRLLQLNYVTIAHNHGHRNELSQTEKQWVHHNIKAAPSAAQTPGRVGLQNGHSKISTDIRSVRSERCVFGNWIMSIKSKNLRIKMGLAFFMSFFHLIFSYLSFAFFLLLGIHYAFTQYWSAMIGKQFFWKVSYHSSLIRWSQTRWNGQMAPSHQKFHFKEKETWTEKETPSLPYTDLSQQR